MRNSKFILTFALSNKNKYTYKSVEDLTKHITTFYDRVMGCVEEYTVGYPYKQGNGWTDPQMNKEMIC